MLHQESECKNCRASNSLKNCFKEGHLVCTACGFIAVQRFIDETAEYRIFNDDSNGVDPTRTGVLCVMVGSSEPKFVRWWFGHHCRGVISDLSY